MDMVIFQVLSLKLRCDFVSTLLRVPILKVVLYLVVLLFLFFGLFIVLIFCTACSFVASQLKP